jgi:cell division protein ZapA
MAHVVVTIAGRTYRMACDDGEEAHLEELAQHVEEKILSLREGFGDIGEQRIVVMAALTMADEAESSLKKIEALQTEIASIREAVDRARLDDADLRERLTQALNDAAQRIEGAAHDLAQRAAPGPEEIVN